MGDYASVLFWSFIVILACAGGFRAITRLRRDLKDDAEVPAGGFTLSDLRALQKSGQISNEEFEKAKLKVVQAAQAQASKAEAKSADKI